MVLTGHTCPLYSRAACHRMIKIPHAGGGQGTASIHHFIIRTSDYTLINHGYVRTDGPGMDRDDTGTTEDRYGTDTREMPVPDLPFLYRLCQKEQ
jgi:hypothetical protein